MHSKGKATMGNKEVTPKGTASVIHHTAIQTVTPASLCAGFLLKSKDIIGNPWKSKYY